MPFDQLLRLEASSLPFGASVIAVSAITTNAILTELLNLRSAGHPVALIVISAPTRVPAVSLPHDIPVYFVTQNWTDLDALELD